MRLDTRLNRLPMGHTLQVNDEMTVKACRATHYHNTFWVCKECAFLTEDGPTGCPMWDTCFANRRPDGQSVYFKRIK